ncbi:universal stress protein [Natronococcus occultus]|uniref:Universal stress protein UspA-like protein n=1 Tax=Natronococcus occultus SP4 TaxID=694430 RepID=L0K1Z7_9EURY|nr:universal stress protein [Natronococcus occultus]AGB39307.1 universal stress protein UspA-like protein [Natronococcus occultus SP4]
MEGDVLLATDGSDLAAAAAEHGLAVADRFGAAVRVVSVADENLGEPDRARHREFVDRIERDAHEDGLSTTTSVRSGQPSRELLADADEHDVGLIVMATHGRTGLRRWLLGSVAIAVVREAHCPVLTVNPTAADAASASEIEDVLIATDGRPGVEAAVDSGLEFAAAYGARVHAVSVVDDVHSHTSVVLEALEDVAERSTTAVAERASGRGLETQRAIERGTPHREIVDYATDRSVDLVVVGTESRTGLDRVVAGSVSQRVIGTAPVPVVSVRTLDR